MDNKQYWPNEFTIYYYRLEQNIRDFIIKKVKENLNQKEGLLHSFISIVNKLLESKGIYLNNSEFLALGAAVLQLEGKYDEVLALSNLDEEHPGLLNAKVYALISQRKFDLIDQTLEQARIYSINNDPYNYLLSIAYDVLYQYYKQDFETSKEKITDLQSEYYRLREQCFVDNNFDILLEPLILGESVRISLMRRAGNIDEAAKLGKTMIDKSRQSKNRYLLNRLLNNTAICLIESGKLREGLLYLEEAFEFSQLIANELQLAIGANNIGFIYRNMGNLEKSMHYFFIALENAKVAKVLPYIVASHTNIAHLHLDFGNPQLALSNSEDVVRIVDENKEAIPAQIKIALDYCRIDIFESLNRFEDAEKTVEEALADIEENNLTSEFPKIYIRKARLAARQSNLGEAIKFLQKAHDMALERNLFEIIINTKLQLAEIDLLKYRMTSEINLLIQALEKIEDAKILSMEQNYKLILIDILILEGLLLSLNNKQKEGRKVLEDAIELAKEYNLNDKVIEAKSQLNELEKEKKSLLVRLFTRINESIRKTISFESVAKPKKMKENLVALMIISQKSGLPIFKKEFDEKKTIDSNLLSGLLSAIRSMGQTVLSSKDGGLKLIDHGDVAIMLETSEDFFYSLIVTRESFVLREKLRGFQDEISKLNLFKHFDHSVIHIDEENENQIKQIVQEYFE